MRPTGGAPPTSPTRGVPPAGPWAPGRSGARRGRVIQVRPGRNEDHGDHRAHPRGTSMVVAARPGVGRAGRATPGNPSRSGTRSPVGAAPVSVASVAAGGSWARSFSPSSGSSVVAWPPVPIDPSHAGWPPPRSVPAAPLLGDLGADAPRPSPAGMAAKIQSLLADGRLGGQVTASVVDAASGEPIYDLNGGRPVGPRIDGETGHGRGRPARSRSRVPPGHPGGGGIVAG